MFKIGLIISFVIGIVIKGFGIESISIITDRENLQNSITKLTIKDCTDLLQRACNCPVTINNQDAEILLKLPTIEDVFSDEPSRFQQSVSYPYLSYPSHDYTWHSGRYDQQIILELETTSFNGISCGLYGLLQEQLWFGFYHAKETYVPKLEYWPVTEDFSWTARARFDKKGFHLHTMHPIELTECLLQANHPSGLKEAKAYINWLARNQQNYFEFNLLEGIDRKEWPEYIRKVVNYGRSRGVIMGLDVSMHMVQQKAFMLYKSFPFALSSPKKQIKKNLDNLFRANWDVLSVEFSTTEYSKGNERKNKKLQLYLTELMKERKDVKLMGREHVVKKDHMLGSKKKTKAYEMTEEEKALDLQRGVLVHTVMFYSAVDEKAPVYENENLKHMYDQLEQAQKTRETWYYPESAYWVTFDNSVPMLLLPYLNARLDDIKTMDALGVKGHLTFSSGWEWGYWLNDWSIARWSWQHEFNGKPYTNTSLQCLTDVVHDVEVAGLLNQALDLQQTYIKDKELIRYMVAQSPTDELPKPANKEFHPRPKWSYKWLRKKADQGVIDSVRTNVVDQLVEFANQTHRLTNKLDELASVIEEGVPQKLFTELLNGIKITAYRAEHKAYTLSYLLSKREAELEGKAGGKDVETGNTEDLENAIAIREKALAIVKEQEKIYRYPIESLTGEYESHTAYQFGYLYPVHDLYFWDREEQQVKNDKYGPFFKLLWNMPRIIGVVD
ncbi:MAG: hypothetical protein MK212_03630 [Saprospiraceae bacterium]|nr:hypothetical protein [Saprospiraceae bacterium]